MKTFRQSGHRLDYLNEGSLVIASGQVVDIGDWFGIAVAAIAADAVGVLEVSGVHELAATAGDAWPIGDTLYWDAANECLTDSPSGGDEIGIAAAAKEAGDELGLVVLNGNPGTTGHNT
jgi:predicted RecA/RadA family phage recombinase